MSQAWCGAFLALALAGVVGATARAGSGVYGGYVGSDSSMNTDIQNMGRRALSKQALQSHNGYPGQAANGPDVTLHIIFPSQQTGLSNIEMVMLVPERPGAHDCQALAQEKSRNELYSLFIPKKDVRAGMLYDVVASDAMGDQFIVGRVSVSGAPTQDFIINAPQLTPGSPHYQGPASAQGFAIAYPGGNPAVSNWPRGAAQEPAPANPQAWLRAKEEFRREADRQPWVMGMKVLTITPYMLAAVGHPSVHLRGVIVYAVMPGGPAEVAGIRKGDLIAKAGGQRCVSAAQFVQYARTVRGSLDLVMYSQLHHAIVRMRVIGDVRHRPQPGYGAAEGGGAPGAARGWQQHQDLVNPLLPGSSSFQPPVTGPGYVPPGQAKTAQRTATPNKQTRPQSPTQGSSAFTPPTTGPGYQTPGHSA